MSHKIILPIGIVGKPVSRMAAAVIVAIWLLLAALAIVVVMRVLA